MPAIRTKRRRDCSTTDPSTDLRDSTECSIPPNNSGPWEAAYNTTSDVEDGRIAGSRRKKPREVDTSPASVDVPRESILTKSPAPKSPQHKALDLPEIWICITEHVVQRSDLKALSVVSKNARLGALPKLYRRPLIIINEQERIVLDRFCSPKNDGLEHVKHLTVAPLPLPVAKERRLCDITLKRVLHPNSATRVSKALPLMPNLQSVAFSCYPHEFKLLRQHGFKE
ncbi:hypothetical protein E4T39_07601 [Aureobasidium subglaciale]|nr:hypothetical protein E4T39_07601 [Aureobasidium subglaciale]